MGHPALSQEFEAAAIIEPCFDAVRDIFVEAHKSLGEDAGLAKVEFRVIEAAHDTDRHFARTLWNGKRIEIAPEGADLALETLTPIIGHEFGHADDLLHPGRWVFVGREKPAQWVPEDTSPKKKKALQRRWLARTDDEIEWWADAIAFAILGKRIGYCGPCLVQCFDGAPRPKGLR